MGALEKYKYGGKKRCPIPPVFVCLCQYTIKKRKSTIRFIWVVTKQIA